MGVDMLLEAKWMAKCFVTHGTFPFTATHIWAHTLYMTCQVAQRGEDFAAFSTGITFSANSVVLWVHINISNTEYTLASKYNLIVMLI